MRGVGVNADLRSIGGGNRLESAVLDERRVLIAIVCDFELFLFTGIEACQDFDATLLILHLFRVIRAKFVLISAVLVNLHRGQCLGHGVEVLTLLGRFLLHGVDLVDKCRCLGLLDGVMKLGSAIFGSRGGPAVDADAANWRQTLPRRCRANLARVSKVRSHATVSLVSLD